MREDLLWFPETSWKDDLSQSEANEVDADELWQTKSG